VNTYRVWLRCELFRGRLTESGLGASEANLGSYIRSHSNTRPHLLYVQFEEQKAGPGGCKPRSGSDGQIFIPDYARSLSRSLSWTSQLSRGPMPCSIRTPIRRVASCACAVHVGSASADDERLVRKSAHRHHPAHSRDARSATRLLVCWARDEQIMWSVFLGFEVTFKRESGSSACCRDAFLIAGLSVLAHYGRPSSVAKILPHPGR
jgi:hypothetical protein